MFLERLVLNGCDSMEDISTELFPRTRSLSIDGCRGFRRLLIPTETEILGIFGCENLKTLSVACRTQTMSLRELYIVDCGKLKSLPESMQEIGGLPFNLELLEIDNCKKLVNGLKKWRLQRLPCLTDLRIKHDGSDEEILTDQNWEMPCLIRYRSNLKTLSSQVFKSLTSLEGLSVGYLPQVWSLLEEGLPPSLSELILFEHHELHSLLMESLRRLPKLRSLRIHECHQLQSLTESALPSSLTELTIFGCPNLQSLPVKGIPSSLSKLSISCCPLVKQHLEFEKGDYWPSIAHISKIYIDGEYL